MREPSLQRPTAAPGGSAVRLMRSFCQDWLNRADAGVCSAIMREDYEVQIGGILLKGLGEYVPATLGQLKDFHGLQITVHELCTNGTQIALRFTEHGASLKAEGKHAAWRGIALFWTDGTSLIRNVTEEDYTSRRRQLISGKSDPVDRPAAAPWSTSGAAPNLEAERHVRLWLQGGGLADAVPGSLVFDEGTDASPILDVTSTTVEDLFSAGNVVAFRVIENGGYRAGLSLPAAAVGTVGALSTVGMVHVRPDGGIDGHLVRDRAGLRRSLSHA